jgi:hypothetical protein
VSVRTIHPNNEEVRAWADERYYDVPTRGKLPAWVIEEWDKTHPKRKYIHEQAHHGTLTGNLVHGCKCNACLTRRRTYQNEWARGKRAAAA